MGSFTDIIKIDLTFCKSVKAFQRLIDDNGLTNFLSAKALFDLRKTVDAIYLDSQTFRPFAITEKGNQSIEIVKDYLFFLLFEKKGISFGKKKGKEKKIITTNVDYDIDTLLDKINESGIESLSVDEKSFLESK